MTTAAPMQYLEELSGWVIDQQQHVSYRWLAHVLAVDVDAAKRMLYDFSQAHQDLWCSYLVAGQTKEASYAITVVPSKDLEATKQQFSKIHSVHVYSVAPQPTESAATQVASADNDQLKKALTDADGEAMRTNSLGHIHFTGLKVGEPGRRQLQIAALEDASNDPVRSASLPKQSVAATENKLKRPASVGAFFSQQQTKKSVSKQETSQETGEKDATEDFKPANNKPADNKKKTPNSESNLPAEMPMAIADKLDGDTDDDEQEWDDGSGAASTSKSQLISHSKKEQAAPARIESSPAKRQRESEPEPEPEPESESESEHTAVTEAATANGTMTEAGEVEETTTSEPKLRKRGRKKKMEENQDEQEQPKEKLKVHGAMDNFMAESETPNIVSRAPGRVKRKKLVEKTYLDERGYLVTENIMEEVSEDEADTRPPPPAPVPAPKSTKPASKASKAAAGAPQRSISSFFGRK